MKTLEDLKSEKNKILADLQEINKQINKKLKKVLVKYEGNAMDKGCGMALEIGELEYIQTHWYESPYGCTGGDQWHPAEGQFVCPFCGVRTRLYDKPDIQGLKYVFKSIKNEYRK